MTIIFSRASRKYLVRCGQKTRSVGKYRVLYIWEKDEIRIIDIDTRGDAYK
jgi:hypothetical protein